MSGKVKNQETLTIKEVRQVFFKRRGMTCTGRFSIWLTVVKSNQK